MRRIERALWVIEHVNSGHFIGRFDGRWTRTRDLDAAALWQSEGEAQNALQALLAEAADRCARSKEQWPADMWWNLHGGMTVAREVRQVTSVVESAESSDARLTPGAEGKACGSAAKESEVK